MKEGFWTLVEQAYFEAVQLDADARKRFLATAYKDRADIRQEVESLLEHERAASRIEPAAASIALEILDNENLIGNVIASKYRIRDCIATTPMSEVYVADHISLNSSFALKRPAANLGSDPDYRRRFLDEARRAVMLKHDNIARVHDVLEDGEDIFVVTEWIEGETLRARLDRLARPLTIREFLPIAKQSAAALAAAHAKRIAHLDVKPANIILTTSDEVKMCDFGVARRLSSTTTESTDEIAERWKFAGTVLYMAPEVILSYQFDERADLFSLGIVFYEMLSGHNPFIADTALGSSTKIVTETPGPISANNPEITPHLERIVFKLLAKEPENRFVTPKELIDELNSVERAQNRIGKMWQSFWRGFQRIAAG